MKKSIITIVLILTILAFTACDLMFGMFQPDYAGSWSITDDSGLIGLKTTYSFSRDSYEMMVEYVGSDEVSSEEVIIDFIKIQGYHSGTDTTITMTPRKGKEVNADFFAEDFGDKTFADAEWIEFSDEDVESETLTWVIKDDVLTLTFPAVGDEESWVLVLSKEEDSVE